MYRCDECGFVYDLSLAQSTSRRLVEGSAELVALLTPPADVRSRRHLGVWSPLEYVCHVRDVFLVQRERVLAARRLERPSFTTMGRDERVAFDGYAEQEPVDVARQLLDAARLLANVLARLDEGSWDRPVVYQYPRPQERSLRWVAVHTRHEIEHHLLDVRRQLDPAPGD